MIALPTGTVTFLFTDIEGSTRLAQQHAAAWPAARARHHVILQRAIESHRGHVFQVIGDAFCAAFHTAPDALTAALEAQRALVGATTDAQWTNGQAPAAPIRVRMGLHTGAAKPLTTAGIHIHRWRARRPEVCLPGFRLAPE